MAPADQKALTTEPVEVEPALAPSNGFLSRDGWLAAAGKLREETHDIEGLGKVLLGEVSGQVRADIMSDVVSEGFKPEEKRRIDQAAYQKRLLLAGVLDPESPAGARTPLFKPGDADRILKIGGQMISDVIDVIERLSGLGQYQAAAEKNSETTTNGAGTSA